MPAVCVRKLSAEVLLAGEKSGKCIASEIARKHDVDNRIGKWLNVTDETWTTLIENENQRLAGGCKFTYKLFLLRREIEVIDIARSLAIGILTHTGYNDIGRGCGTYG